MKKVNLFTFFLIITLVYLCLPAQVQAQEEDEGHIFLSITRNSLIPEDGSRAERDSLLTLYYDQVVKNNEFILSEKTLWHLYGSNSSDWLVIIEYENWNAIEEADKRSNELFLEKWDTPEKQKAFNMLISKYFGEHSDEIYMEAPKFGK